jgi:phenylalanyl-tRNA synthetase beta chain
MRVSVAWLRELLPGLSNLDTAAIAARLTGAGLEVESVLKFGEGIEPVVVARVLEKKPHPKRGSLQLVRVDKGPLAGGEQEVVCGAPNVPAIGGLVLLAPVGTTLPAVGVTLTPRDIGGVISEGMLVSERELGIGFGEVKKAEPEKGGDKHAGDPGIIVLPEGFAAPGTPFHVAVPSARDDVMEIGVTPNRPDALGHVGVARELAALLDLPFTPPAHGSFARSLGVAVAAKAKVTVDPAAAERCPEYAAMVAEGLAIGPSPLWVRYRLHALGVRSLSNVVDVTNLIMMEQGHPLHAFDLDKLVGQAIHVRLAREGEKVVTLDGAERTLVADDLVICDGAEHGGKPVALAGVMGAGNSEIDDKTTRVLFECAWFDPRSVRRTARRHGLHTESSHRFERGVDRLRVRPALERTAALSIDFAGGGVADGAIDVASVAYAPRRVFFRASKIADVLGVEVDRDEAAALLRRLGCEVAPWSGEGARATTEVVLPSHRPDLAIEVDLVEEIGRCRGYDAIPAEVPTIPAQAARYDGWLERRARHAARELGLAETISYSFTSPRELQAVGAPEASVLLQNPLGEERSVMRTSLLPGVLGGLARSRRRGERRVRIFEVGRRFLAGGAEAARGLCDEVPSLALVLAGPRDAWIGEGAEVDVWDVKGIAVELVQRLSGRVPEVALLAGDARPSHLHPRGAGALRVEGQQVGTFGPLHPDVVDRLELDGPALVAEIDLRAIERLGAARPAFRALPTLPASTRDVALIASETLTAGDLASTLQRTAGELCEGVELFDLYRGEGVPAGQRSLAFRLTYRDPKMTRTLTDAEVDALHAKALEAVKAMGATPRA